MKNIDKLRSICEQSLTERNLDERYARKLAKELKEIEAQGEQDYLLNLKDKFNKERLIFPKNEHNNLVDWLLGLTSDFDINKESAFIQGEMPDIDIDYIKEVRDYLKRDWAPKKFGQDYVCEIGTYAKLGIKSAILDMAKMHGLDKSEIQSITVKMKDKFQNDEGNTQDLSWDDALELYPEFKKYCEDHSEVAADAKKSLDRNKSAGVHAGGLIISSVKIDGFVPLEVRSASKDNPAGVICSAWTEGLNRQDLGPVGLVKFDLLVINNLIQIALACKMIKERHGIKSICALPEGRDWSDISYLNDPESIAMANKADLKGIFQFDSPGIRNLVKKGGVDRFDDLVNYTSIYRPATLSAHMDVIYCKRKKGQEEYEIHPVLEDVLGDTYGIILYQEQCQEILRIVGEIPDMHTEKVRKAISKKKKKDFEPYKEMFIENGQKVLGTNAIEVKKIWDLIERFALYSFNKSHSCAYTYISSRLLWLKAHYPIEFYTAILMCEKDDEKFKEYKIDADQHNIKVLPVHINNSKQNFSIIDNNIIFGFSNIKDVGEGVADRIVANQPYKNYCDFLTRFGTELTPIKALTSLGVFDENKDRLTLRKFADHYIKRKKSFNSSQKTFHNALKKFDTDLESMLLTKISKEDVDFEKLCNFESQELWESRFAGVLQQIPCKVKGKDSIKNVLFISLLNKLAEKRKKRIEGFSENNEDIKDSFDQFDPQTVELNPEEIEILTDELTINGTRSYPLAERKYYGFQWTHRLETCKKYEGFTIDKFLKEVDEENVVTGMIEVEIISVEKRIAKNKKGTEFYTLVVEDANGKQMKMNMWMKDFMRFGTDLVPKQLAKIRVKPPSGGFNTLTFESLPFGDRKVKEEDYRVIIMKPEEN